MEHHVTVEYQILNFELGLFQCPDWALVIGLVIQKDIKSFLEICDDLGSFRKDIMCEGFHSLVKDFRKQCF